MPDPTASPTPLPVQVIGDLVVSNFPIDPAGVALGLDLARLLVVSVVLVGGCIAALLVAILVVQVASRG